MFNYLFFFCLFCVILDVFFFIFKELELDLLVWLFEGIDLFLFERKEIKYYFLLKFLCFFYKMINV